MEMDEYGMPLKYGRIPEAKRVIESLPPVDHSKVEYPPFRKNFYQVRSEGGRRMRRKGGEGAYLGGY